MEQLLVFFSWSAPEAQRGAEKQVVQTVFVPQGNIITTIVEDTRIEDHTYHTTHLTHDDDRQTDEAKL